MRLPLNFFQHSAPLRRSRAAVSVSYVDSRSFNIIGPAEPVSPVVLSVPHAGRDYPLALRAALRVPQAALLPLEDRHVDAVALAARRDETLFLARRPRAWIDLNRAEHERDPRIDDGALPSAAPFISAKVRGGLGLVPRRVAGAGDLWVRRWAADEITARIMADHRPYHMALAETLRVTRERFGIAILVDLHSMPPPANGSEIVVGDRFGRSAGARFVGRLEGVARAHGVRVAVNTPYPGGHILDRHGAPRRNIHAIQLEICRRMYLDAALSEPGPGLETMASLLREMIDALADEALPGALAAE